MKCPRCGSETVRVMTKSPVGDVWEVYVCDTCYYSLGVLLKKFMYMMCSN